MGKSDNTYAIKLIYNILFCFYSFFPEHDVIVNKITMFFN